MCINAATLIRQTLDANPQMTCGRDTQAVLSTALVQHGMPVDQANREAMPHALRRSQERKGQRDCTTCILRQAALATAAVLTQAPRTA